MGAHPSRRGSLPAADRPPARSPCGRSSGSAYSLPLRPFVWPSDWLYKYTGADRRARPPGPVTRTVARVSRSTTADKLRVLALDAQGERTRSYAAVYVVAERSVQ